MPVIEKKDNSNRSCKRDSLEEISVMGEILCLHIYLNTYMSIVLYMCSIYMNIVFTYIKGNAENQNQPAAQYT